MAGTLYIVATPIGNLGDMTLRAIETLKNVDLVYAEDTRVSRVLLDRYEIKKPMRSYREAADRNQVARIITEISGELTAGKDIAYVSDAGTPGVSDPGDYLVSQVAAAGFIVVPIPGASALPTLMSASGLAVQRPLFVGFLPKKKGHQTLLVKLKIALESDTCDGVILYESPERILRTIDELLEWKIELRACLGRELTKQFEEIIRGSLEEVREKLAAKPTIKGECVLLISTHA